MTKWRHPQDLARRRRITYSASDSMALKAVARRLFAFLDDLYVICRPDRVRELWDHARISLHNGETKVWNRGGIAPSGWSNLQQMASKEDPDACQRSDKVS